MGTGPKSWQATIVMMIIIWSIGYMWGDNEVVTRTGAQSGPDGIK